ncbi:phosphatidylserine decarboxylase-domain-containing protein [Kockovaella imperatae]|uniref:Phosphatidylserine decarboxylase-domain-containing protein n=1 Tax=Kockovaella imperatae TaxID=4999 RepID=A0A1Y1UF89_9TREE|nr:phosphatidylserine decarboxylase-domain-containing protein [Kockovaella imperatae]ORX36174.1 phosphatidylserine decarboxylase-domain-containing protein [Kockovaella imperatae]
MSNNPGATEQLPDEMGEPLEKSLDHLVEHSRPWHDVGENDELAPSEKRQDLIHAHGGESKSWIKKLWPSSETVDHLFKYEHMGNYVIDRQNGRKIFESMPLYVRVGMHLLFVSGATYMSYPSIESMLESKSQRQGELYDETGPGVKEHIQSFIDTYKLPLNELLIQDLDKYPTFNSFFSRRLAPSARPITSPEDTSIVCVPSDCRLTVFQTVDQAKQFWIKGKQFTLKTLLCGDNGEEDEGLQAVWGDEKSAVAVCRLAPQDYHRFHSPVEGTLVSLKDIKGTLYTVNPQAVNEDLNVFTLNKRAVMLIHANLGPGREQVPVVLVAVGAMLVGSIGWSKKPGDKIAKGEDMGWFQYGGSTVICVFPSATGITFDEDLVTHSKASMETLVRVGMEMGKVAPA